MKKIPLTQGKFAIVDDKDFLALSKFKWLFDDGYAKRHKPSPEVGWLLMHRVIMKTKMGMFTDHINGNKLDNRRVNLRICTNAQNMMNRGRQSNNSSGFRGVAWHKQRKKWRAFIKINGKQKSLGLYENINDAVKVYEKEAQMIFKEFKYKTKK
jgi:hypothetical protein